MANRDKTNLLIIVMTCHFLVDQSASHGETMYKFIINKSFEICLNKSSRGRNNRMMPHSD